MVDGGVRDFVDFVRNIGQPPDKDFGGGSFGVPIERSTMPPSRADAFAFIGSRRS